MIDITSVRVKLAGPETPDKRCLAYCSIVLDGCFVVHDIRVIDGHHGATVVMPDKHLRVRCPWCPAKVISTATFCHRCGKRQQAPDPEAARFANVAHPLTATCRAYLQERVLDAYRDELGRAENCPEEWDRKMDAVLDARKANVEGARNATEAQHG